MTSGSSAAGKKRILFSNEGGWQAGEHTPETDGVPFVMPSIKNRAALAAFPRNQSQSVTAITRGFDAA
jgi:hypothetical protein